MKKLSSFILIGILSLTVVGCGNENDNIDALKSKNEQTHMQIDETEEKIIDLLEDDKYALYENDELANKKVSFGGYISQKPIYDGVGYTYVIQSLYGGKAGFNFKYFVVQSNKKYEQDDIIHGTGRVGSMSDSVSDEYPTIKNAVIKLSEKELGELETGEGKLYTKEDFKNGNIDEFLYDLIQLDTYFDYSLSKVNTVFADDYEEVSHVSLEGEVSQVFEGIIEDDYSYTVTYENTNSDGENGYLIYSLGNVIYNNGKLLKLNEGNYIKIYEGLIMPIMKDINGGPFHEIIPVYFEVFDIKNGNLIYSSFDR